MRKITLLIFLFSFLTSYPQCGNPPEVNISADNLSICEGETIFFQSELSEDSGWEKTYQWQVNNSNITGENSADFESNSLNDNSNIRLKVTFSCGEEVQNVFSNVLNIEVFDYPTVNQPSNIESCKGETIPNINFQGSNSQANYQWSNDNTSIGLAATGNGSISSFTAQNNSTQIQIANLTVTPSFNGCTGNPKSFTIKVFPETSVNAITDITVCDGESVNTVNFSGNGVNGISYQWSNNNTAIGLQASGTGNINSFTASNTTNAQIISEISVVPFANGCEGNPQTFKIKVNPTPSVNKPENIVVCEDEFVPEISFNPQVAGTSISWTNDNTASGLAASGTGKIPGFTAENPSDATITSTITLTPTANGCTGNSKTFTIKVKPKPKVNAVEDQVYCNDEDTESIPLSGTPSNLTFDISGGSSIGLNDRTNVNSIPSFTTRNSSKQPKTVTIEVTPKANGCIGESKTFNITVNPTPSVTKPENIVVCEGEFVSGISFDTRVDGTSVSWTNDDTASGLAASGTESIPGFNAENPTDETLISTITLTPTANGCTGNSKTFTIKIKPKPEVDTIDDKVFCNGITSENIPLSGAPSNVTFDISGGSSIGLNDKNNINSIPSFTPTNNSNEPKTVTIEVIPKANGCVGESKTFNITVNPTPNLSISPSAQEICNNGETDISFSGSVSGTTFSWTVSEISPSGSITGASDGTGTQIQQILTNPTNNVATVTYNVTPKAGECTGSPIAVKVTVNPTPILQLNEPDCAESADLTAPAITAGSTSGLTFNYWQDEDKTTAVEDPTQVGSGTYFIEGITTSGCSVIEQIQIDKIQPQVINLDEAPTSICSSTNFNFSPESDIEGTTFSWTRAAVGENVASSSSSRNSDNPNETLINTSGNSITATYVFTLTAPNGCSSTQEIEVIVEPEAHLIEEPIADMCNGETISYTPQSSLSNASISWSRNAVAGNPAASGTGTINETLYNDTGVEVGVTYFITIETSAGCTTEDNISFSLLSGPKVTASASEIEVCEGEVINLFSEIEDLADKDPILFDENFNNGLGNWRRTNNSSDGADPSAAAWSLENDGYSPGYNVTIHSNDNSRFIMSNSDAQGPNGYTQTILEYKDPVNTMGYSTLELSFWQYYEHYSSLGEVQVSTDEQNWQTVYDINSSSNGVKTVNLNGYVGQEELYIRFKYQAYWGYWWALDNIQLSGEPAEDQNITWTSNTSNWTSTEQNPENVSLTETTIFTVSYTDPDLECPGVQTVEVKVKNPPQPEILADYCAYPNEPNKIKLYVPGNYDEYEWTSSGEVVGTSSSIDVISAQGYTVRVWENGCEGTATIDISENLVENGDFEEGNTGFNTQYGYRTDNPGVSNELYPEGLYAVDVNSNEYHDQFHDNGDHTSGSGNFMIVNGDPNLGNVVWETDGYLDVRPDTDYYFGAWTTNLVARSEADKYAQLRLVVIVPGSNGQDQVSAESTLGDLRFQPVGEWIEFYNPQVWNSGNNTRVKLKIINENTIRDGNDFGIDDISFAEISAVEYEFEPSNTGPYCEGDSIQLNANLEGGREPIIYSWTGPNGFTSEEANPVIENATPDLSGDYNLTVTDFYGCAVPSETTEVIVNPKTVVNAGEDFSVCADGTQISLNGTINGSAQSGVWSGGNGTFSPAASSLDALYTPAAAEIEAGFVELILTSDTPTAPCSVVKDTLQITINPLPVAEVETVNNNCFNGTSGEATVSISNGEGPFTYLWSDGQTTATATGLSAGDYSVTVTNENGCETTSEITILEPEALEIVSTDFSNLSCFESEDGLASIELKGGFLDDDTPEYIIDILDDSGEVVTTRNSVSGLEEFENLPAGNYTFSVHTKYNCTTLTKPFTLTQPEEILIDAGEDQTIITCGTTSVQLNAAAVDENLASGNWKIIDGDGGSFEDATVENTVFTGQPNTTYTLQWVVTPKNGCQDLTQEIQVQLPGGCSKLDFDGENDYVYLGDNYNLGSNFTIEVWVKPHSLNGIKTILSKRDASNLGSGGFDLILKNGKPTFRYNSKSVTSNFKIDTDRWYHVAVISTGSQIQLLVDGVEIISTSANSLKTIAKPFLIGAMDNPDSSTIPQDFFHGWIEEMRIWKSALSIDQVRFMMNQRLENNNSMVKGSVLPMDVPGNLGWDKLDGYYRLLVSEVTGGITPDISNNSVSGELRNMETEQENSAPLPYILENASNGEWFEKSTWTLPATMNGKNLSQRNVWDPPNSKSISPSENIEWNIAILRDDVKNSGTPNNKNSIKMLGLISDSGKLNMMGENNFSGNSLEISHYLKLNGIIDLNGESQLIQKEGSILDEASSGQLYRDQQGTKNSFNYNYWSSPVSLQGQPNNSGFKIDKVLKDGSNGTNPQDISFSLPFNYADNSYSGALRISTYWLYIFHGDANNYGYWEHIDENTPLKTGEGYTMKGTKGYVNLQDLQNYTFVGKPNNGDIQLSISTGENRLIGNPYPSALDATEFLRDNLKDLNGARNNKNVFNGTLYFWDHFGKENTHILEEYVGGYAALNLSGGIPGVSNDQRINANGNSSSKAPARFIPVGQGFFVNTVIDQNSNNNFSVQGGTVTFKNSQRVYSRENPGNSQFLQQEVHTKSEINNPEGEDIRPKIRLKYNSSEGYHRQILATADYNSSLEMDLGYDAPLIETNKEDMYWIIDESNFVIQGVPNFSKEKILPLGVRISSEKSFSIQIDSLENWNSNVSVYLKDKQKDSIHDLTESKYTTTSEIGEITDRFEIVFADRMVKPEKPILEDGNIEVYYSNDQREFLLKNPELSEISEIMIFDIGGKLLEKFKDIPIQKFYEFQLNRYPTGIYIIKVIDKNGASDKKFIIK